MWLPNYGLEELTEVAKHELSTLAECIGIRLLGDNGLCPLKLFSHCDIQFATGWYIQKMLQVFGIYFRSSCQVNNQENHGF